MKPNKIALTVALFLAGLFLTGVASVSAQSFQGVTCDDVRALSPAERDYWSHRLNLSSAQRHRIQVACLQNNLRHRGRTVRVSAEALN